MRNRVTGFFGAKLSLEIIDNAKLCEESGKCMQNKFLKRIRDYFWAHFILLFTFFDISKLEKFKENLENIKILKCKF